MDELETKIEEFAALLVSYRQSPLSPQQRATLGQQTLAEVTANFNATKAALEAAALRDPNSPMFDPPA